MKCNMKRMLSLLLALAMLLSLLVIPAGAATKEISGGTTITTGGTYQLASGASGTITIKTTQPVTIVGNGATWNSSYTMTSTAQTNLYFDCTNQAGVSLTLKNVYVSNTAHAENGKFGMIDFSGSGNTLNFEGVNVLECNYTSGYDPAVIHVKQGDALTVGGTGTLYFYKWTQGAGFGGSSGELNGDITFQIANMFAKGSKQGALIGAGSGSSGVQEAPGKIIFNSGAYNLLTVSRGACIGGAAGGGRASSGTEVYINNASININVDYTGSAIGGGGYDQGNDASGGTVYFNGGSLRIYTDANAVSNENYSGTTGYNGMAYMQGTENDASMTAERKNGEGEKVYRCILDTAGISSSEGKYNVAVDGELFYSGGLHAYHYINETLAKDSQVPISTTPSNWEPNPSETKLYLYLTGENHLIEVNGALLMAKWDAESETFTVASHTHSYDGWEKSENSHWKECECGTQKDVAVHTSGPWIEDKAATESELGIKHRECTVCGYVTATGTVSLSPYELVVGDGTSGTAEVKYGDTVTMNVSVTGAEFHGMQAVVTYDSTLFELKSVSGKAAADDAATVGEVELYTLSETGYASGTVAATLTFTAIYRSTEAVTAEFSFADGATVGDYEDFKDDALAAAISGDSVKIRSEAEEYAVTLGSGLNGETTATYDQDYTAEINSYDPIVYAYTVTYTVSGKTHTITRFGSDGSFTIPAEHVTGAISIAVSKTEQTYRVTLPVDNNGFYTVSALGNTTGLKGRTTFYFLVEVEDGYKIDSVRANGVSVAPDEDGIYAITIIADTVITVTASKKDLGGKPEASVWDGKTIDIRWFTDNPGANTFYITYPAELAGLAALVNGIYNEDIEYVWGDEAYIVDKTANGGIGGSNNESTDVYHYGAYDFNGKTIYLCADIDMGSNNYMPVGGQYLMTDEDTTTKLGSSFCGMLDGQGHNVTIYCDRHCSGNYGDGSSIGLIGRLGIHDSDPASWRPAGAGVRNLAVYGYVSGNRSVGGIVGKIGKNVGGVTIENCANFASVYGTDAKGTGGIVGAAWNGGVIQNCYNAGTVTSSFSNCVSGIAGSCEIDLINCYNVGSVIGPNTQTAAIASNNGGSTYKNCYWLAGTADVGVYGSSTTGVAEKTSAEMKADAFVLLLGDAFRKDSAKINSGYPVLTWQGGTKVKGQLTTTTVTNGVATTTVDSDVLVDTLKEMSSGAQLALVADELGTVYKTVTVLSGSNVTKIANAGVSVLVSSSVADIALSKTAMKNIASEYGSTIKISAESGANNTTTVSVTVDGVVMNQISGGMKVTLPVSKITSRTVLVLVGDDGSETVLEDAVFGTNSVTVTVSGSCVLRVKEKAAEALTETAVENGKATVTVDSDSLKEVLEDADEDTVLVIAPDLSESETVTEVTAQLPASAVEAVADSGASLKVETPIADVTLSNEALKAFAAESGKTVNVTVSGNDDGSVTVDIAADGESAKNVSGGVIIGVPANAEDGNVLAIIHADDSQTIVKKHFVGEDGAHKAILPGSVIVKLVENHKTFVDVEEDDWFADGVDFVGAREIFEGMGNDVFAPQGTMTRGMMVTAIHRLEDEMEHAYEGAFLDVEEGKWYTDAIHWAADHGIVEGYGNGYYGTHDEITREQMITMVYRYLNWLGMDTSERGDLSAFTDHGKIHDWALEAMEWGVGAGLIEGVGNNLVDPEGNATRAQVAVFLQRVITHMVQ